MSRSIVRLLPLIAVLATQLAGSRSLEVRYKVCTAKELRKEIENTCIDHSPRDGGSELSVGPYGTLSQYQSEDAEWIEPTDEELIELIRKSTPHRGRRQYRGPRFKRSMPPSFAELCKTLDKCCKISCEISFNDLKTLCRFRSGKK